MTYILYVSPGAVYESSGEGTCTLACYGSTGASRPPPSSIYGFSVEVADPMCGGVGPATITAIRGPLQGCTASTVWYQ